MSIENEDAAAKDEEGLRWDIARPENLAQHTACREG
jgi:hypothetical protein